MRTQQDWLDLLQEECAEVIQIISKARRFGLASKSPRKPELGTVRKRLIQELADLSVVMWKITNAQEFMTSEEWFKAIRIKEQRLKEHPR